MTDSSKTYDIAVLGWWYGKNYGSMLTYYGLNRAIEALGYSVLMVHEPLGYNGYRVKWPDDILSMEFARRMGYNYTEQRDFHELPELNERANTFVVGSDQLWNPLIGRVNDDLFLDFVKEDNARVAYGTSFGNRGTSKFRTDFVNTQSANLQRFKAISVREDYAINTARDVFGVKASLVVDPVFLLPREHYEELADKATFTPLSGEYLTIFFLDPDEDKRDAALVVADKLGFEKILVVPNPDTGRKLATSLFTDDPRVEFVPEDRPENFLRAYRDASYVITDSFHGSAFSVIFEKPFSSIYNTKRGIDRFKNLLGSMGFGDTRRLSEDDDAETIAESDNISRDIDFTKAREYIQSGRESSLKWLKDALDPNKKASAAVRPMQHFSLQNPVFAANNGAWKITPRTSETRLRVTRGGAALGNLVWTALSEPLVKGSFYQLKLEWSVRTTSPLINVHFRNPETGRFRVVAGIELPDKASGARTDTLIFKAPESGLSQFMLGAIHFTGFGAGADVRLIAIDELPAAGAPSPGGAGRSEDAPPAKGFAGQARALALKDYEKQVRSYKHSRTAEGVTGARARMFFHAHAIEKGLTHSNFRPGFGKIAVPGIAKEMNSWLSNGHGTDDIVLRSSAAVMKAYFDRNKKLGADVSHFWELFSQESQDVIENGPYEEGGVLPANAKREIPVVTPDDERRFMDVMYGRRSVREFIKDPVADADIATAVQIAMQSPSVCSRQGGRVHQFADPRIIKQLLDVQGGFVGFEMPPRLLLVTADLDAFLFAPERNQPFVDGGLFMMSLLLGLTQMGLGSCLLNTAMGTEKENKIRRIVDIPEHEVFIAFVAVGHHDEEVLVPRSKRLEAETILQRHAKK